MKLHEIQHRWLQQLEGERGLAQLTIKNYQRLTGIDIEQLDRQGVGETQACGSGACAAAVIGMQQDKLERQVKVALPGGELTIRWQAGQSVKMTGPATLIFDGQMVI